MDEPTDDARGDSDPTEVTADHPATAQPLWGEGCGCLLLLAAVIIGAVFWIGNAVLGSDGGSDSKCEAAWEEAGKTSTFQDMPSTYRRTFSDCATLTEWRAGNRAQGGRLDSSAETVANFCEQLDITVGVCAVVG